jgi:hypothetical protein
MILQYNFKFLGVAFSLGLISNLCEFVFAFENEIEIDRIENIRRGYNKIRTWSYLYFCSCLMPHCIIDQEIISSSICRMHKVVDAI